MSGLAWAAVLVAGYLLGAVPFALIVVRLLTGRDLRRVGSGNPGATNALRAAGPIAGLVVLLLDVGKGALPVLAARALGAPAPVVAAAAVAPVLGHVFSLYLGFRGGKGVATAVGALAALDPWPVVLALAFFGLLVAATRYVSLGSIVLVLAVPALALVLGRLGAGPPAGPYLAAAGAIAALVVVRHAGNIRRLLTGREPRLGERPGGGG